MSDGIKGILWMLGSVISFTVMAIAGRTVSAELDTFEIMLFRSLLGVAIVCLILTSSKRWNDITGRDFHLHLGRNVAHFTGQNLWFFALATIPLAQVFALEFTTPIWVILLAPIFLKERWSLSTLLCATLGFLGILAIARPGVIPMGLGFVTAASSAIGFAIAMLFTKHLTKRNSTLTILFYLTTMQAVFGVICAGYDGDIALPSLSIVPYVLLIGLTGLTAHWSITSALQLAPPSLVAPVDFLRLPLIAVVGAVFYGESVDNWLIVGASLSIAGNYANILLQLRATQTRS
ncbi:DMT family transporter, partial [Cognatishimia sp.]|uniref:DMT family transporter n=1 Tax=Cognatishimia sp. TaxID=2211648 RepID=UPI00351536FB